jgi:hypothetical protein
MATIGIELCDAGLLTASCASNDPHLIDVSGPNGIPEWPGFCYVDGAKLTFGRPAEDMWFVHPRRVAHTFWSRLAHEPSSLTVGLKPPSFSELCFFFFREYAGRLAAAAGPLEKVVVAVPGLYLKDHAAEEEKLGLLLGMFGEMNIPLAGMIDMACAALCDPRADGFNPALPVVVVDLQLEGADITLLGTDEKLERKDFIHLPQLGYAHLLKQVTGTMGNRFLRHTAFDILEDGKIEQTFFRQTKDFLVSESGEWRYHINTSTRGYEMIAKREQLATDAHAFVVALVQGVQSFLQNSPHASEPCTIALTDRTAHLPGIEARLRSAGFNRLLRLPRGAAACGAARIGAARMKVPEDLADVPLEKAVPLVDSRRSTTSQWEARLQKVRHAEANPVPTHAILDGIGHPIGGKPRFTIGLADLGADLALPEIFNGTEDCAVPLLHEGGRLWFVDSAPARPGFETNGSGSRTLINAGDRLTVRCKNASADILFAHCPPNNGRHA